jgi:hypothetical protein
MSFSPVEFFVAFWVEVHLDQLIGFNNIDRGRLVGCPNDAAATIKSKLNGARFLSTRADKTQRLWATCVFLRKAFYDDLTRSPG